MKNNSGIVSLELANEPVHIYNRYGQSSATAMRDYFQPVVDIIRKNGFKGIIWIPGTGYQSQYENYATYPVSDSNFGYAVHVYPGWYGASDKNYDSNAFIYNFQRNLVQVSIMSLDSGWPATWVHGELPLPANGVMPGRR